MPVLFSSTDLRISLQSGGALIYAVLVLKNKGCIHRFIHCRNRRFAGSSIRERLTSFSTFLSPGRGHCRRREKYLWRFHHIVIDIDFQQDFSPDYEAVEQELEQQIRWYGTYGEAPMPNAIVFTGSGDCHLYYIFEDLPNGKKAGWQKKSRR